ncbi:MAG: hypothetical protein ACC630_04475 [Nitrospinota bacterium]
MVDLLQVQNHIEYFKEMVESAIENQRIDTDETMEFYIVNLLSEFIRTDKAYPVEEGGKGEEALVTMLTKTLQSDYNDRIKRFKQLGDFSLFISGFFSDSLNRKLVDIDYYILIGGIAYNTLSQMMRNNEQGELFCNLFNELAEKFQLFVDVIAEVSERSSIKSDKDILRLYERWLRTKSDRDAGLLRKKNIIPSYPENIILQ